MAYQTPTGQLTMERARELFTYSNGHMYWINRPSKNYPKRLEGMPVGTRTKVGYVVTSIRNNGESMRLYLHNLVWNYHHGIIQEGYTIDHINRVKDDNSIDNLRLATQCEQMANKGIQSNNTTGHKAIQWIAKRNKWYVRVYRDRKSYYVGEYAELHDAIAARDNKIEDLNNAKETTPKHARTMQRS